MPDIHQKDPSRWNGQGFYGPKMIVTDSKIRKMSIIMGGHYSMLRKHGRKVT
jgi:hypothetical protein